MRVVFAPEVEEDLYGLIKILVVMVQLAYLLIDIGEQLHFVEMLQGKPATV